jgi:hypothetical protein
MAGPGVPVVGPGGQPSGVISAPVADPVMSADVPADPDGQATQSQQPHRATRAIRPYQYQQYQQYQR